MDRVDARPGGRAARVRAQVHGAVVELVSEGAVDLTLPVVADRAGVSPSTLYRRWGSVPALLDDVAAAGPARTAPLPDTGALEADLQAYARAVSDALAGPLGGLLLRTAVLVATGPGGHLAPGAAPGVSSRVLAERGAQLQHLLDRAAARGEDAPSVDDLLDVVVAPLYLRALFGPAPNHAQADALVDRLLTGRCEAVAPSVAKGVAHTDTQRRGHPRTLGTSPRCGLS
jgi:AcrR family transcriptional regulator